MDKWEEILLLAMIGVLATWGRLVLTLERLTFKHVIRVSVTGGFVGLCLGVGLIDESPLAPWAKYLVFGIAVSLAEDLMAGIFNVGKQWRNDPQSIIRLFRRK